MVESAGFALASVAFDVPSGPSELIKDGKSGFLIKDDDLQEFAHKLKILILDESLRARFGKEAKELIKQNFSKEAILQKWIALFCDMKKG